MQVLDNRLLTAVSYVRKSTVAADIGCDHGKLAVHLVQSKTAQRVIAVDLREMPLEKAIKRVQALNLQDKISCRLGDGLQALLPNEVQDIIIAGMSGVTIFEIITAVDWSKNPQLNFVLVPATKADYLRQSLCENGFEIIDETPVQAQGRAYPVMQVRFTGESYTPSFLFCQLGKCLDKKGNAADALIQKVFVQLKKELKGRKIDARYTSEQISELEAVIDEISHAMEEK